MSSAKLRFYSADRADSEDPLAALDSQQARYLRHYLADLGMTSMVEEQRYFDRDFLAEYSAFYASSVHAHCNLCKRLHFFRGRQVTRARLSKAMGDAGAREALQDDYLGFMVIRPLLDAPIGRTVLAWYPDSPAPAGARITEPSREYRCHLAGITLSVRGLAWQQQDSAVGACATIALWSMLHSSAFDEHHAIPTTAQISYLAHARGSHSKRIFPSSGLTTPQVVDAIQGCRLEPILLRGEISRDGRKSGFSKKRFIRSITSLVGSGYPVLLGGERGPKGVGHAICAVGYREGRLPTVRPGSSIAEDALVEHLYVHDDNLGPGARFEIAENPDESTVLLCLSPPAAKHRRSLDPVLQKDFHSFSPMYMVAAVHEEIRISIDGLFRAGNVFMSRILHVLEQLSPRELYGLTFAVRLMKLSRFMGPVLESTLDEYPKRLTAVRLALAEDVAPMSLFVGIVRLRWNGHPVVDALFDTTLGDESLRAFCAISYHPAFRQALQIAANESPNLGRLVDGCL